jgi:two-component system nitrogen regulation response regulator NtrX
MVSSILIVDDEAGVRASLSGILRDEGYTVDAVATGEACLEEVGRRGYDVILLDIWLPGVDGLVTLERLRDRRVDAQVIMISGHANIESAVRATKLGAFDFIEKPLSLEKTVLAVRNGLRQRRLEAENRALRARVDRRHTMVGESRTMERLREQIAMAAPTNGRVLISGENGTGKELVARQIHALSHRRAGPFVEVNCAALPEELIESELFGHTRGAFTGAVADRRGKFETASGGTLFLDEVGDLPAAMQVKLLRVLQDHVFQPLGTERSIQADVRVIAASNIPLEDAVQAGRFRKDLYYRLAVITLHAPPLRERPEDILPLAEAYARHFAAELGRPGPTLTQGARDMLLRYAWPGNVRELINVVERAVLLGSGPSIDVGDLPLAVSMDQPEAPTKAHLSLDRREASNLPPTQAPTNGAPVSYSDARRDALRAFEVQYFTTLLDQTGGRVGRVAELAGISQRSLFDKLRQYGIRKEDFRSRWGHAHG